MDPYRLFDPETFEVRQSELIRTCHPLAAHKLAGDDLRARLVADIALGRQMRAAGLRPAGVGSVLGSTRQRLGSLLVRMGRCLQGTSGGDLGAQPGLKATSATR